MRLGRALAFRRIFGDSPVATTPPQGAFRRTSRVIAAPIAMTLIRATRRGQSPSTKYAIFQRSPIFVKPARKERPALTGHSTYFSW
jgi:hypothetical protein